MNDGNYFVTIQFPVPWPVKSSITFMEQSDQRQEFKLHAYSDGHVSFEHKSSSNSFNYHTQPIKTSVGGWVVFDAAWNGSEVDVCINGIALKPFSAGIETAIIEGKPFIEQPFELSIHHSIAHSNCENWITWRKEKFPENIQINKVGYRSKTIEEQLIELENELQALQELSEQVRTGKTHMLTKIAGSLRALVCWKLSNKGSLVTSYNPLLFRLASRLNLPLPVFMSPPDLQKPPESINDAHVHFSRSFVSLTRRHAFEVVLDLQDYLLQENIKVRIFLTGALQIFTCHEVILQCSNKLGGAHFDEDVPIALDSLQGLTFNKQDSLTTLLLEISDVVCGLGEYVINSSINKNI